MTDESAVARTWAESQIRKYARRRPGYVTLARTLDDVLRQASRRIAPSALIETRPKEVTSFAGKIWRKSHPGLSPVDEFTDLAGGRVVTQTVNELHAVCDFIERNFEIDWPNSEDVSRRMKPSEFGYRSVHYIVSFKPGVFPNPEVPVDIPDKVLAMRNQRAEIQVRTLLEHAWASIAHDIAYKGDFSLPDRWEREFARLAASLEHADGSITRIIDGLRVYEAAYGAYMSPERMRDEIARAAFVLEHDPDNVKLAMRVARLNMALGEWAEAVAVLAPFEPTGRMEVLRDLGVATCKVSAKAPRSRRYMAGQALLERACAHPDADADAFASYAATFEGLDEDAARDLYRNAFELDPTDPYAFGKHIEHQVAYTRDVGTVRCVKPTVESVLRRCAEQIEVGVNLPWAYFSVGEFSLLLGRSHEALSAYAKALSLSTAEFMIDSSLESLRRLEPVRGDLEGYGECERLLLLGAAVRFPSAARGEQVRTLSTRGRATLAAPVVVVAGGCEPEADVDVVRFSDLLSDALAEFGGTVISGGTTAGAARLVGDAVQAGSRARAVGYIPGLISSDAVVDRDTSRYAEIRKSGGRDFGAAEPLQYWTDIIASRIPPADVRVLGIGGGPISALEYRFALAFGARVGVLPASGREAARILNDPAWSKAPGLFSLAAEPALVEAFLLPPATKLPKRLREKLGRAVHDRYVQAERERMTAENPSTADWDSTRDYMRESNMRQADDIAYKLALVGCEMAPGPSAAVVPRHEDPVFRFTAAEVELLAEREHARWVIERLSDGWRPGPRDVANKVSPYLVGWADLPDNIKDYDRATVRAIPRFLREVGLEVRRTGSRRSAGS